MWSNPELAAMMNDDYDELNDDYDEMNDDYDENTPPKKKKTNEEPHDEVPPKKNKLDVLIDVAENKLVTQNGVATTTQVSDEQSSQPNIFEAETQRSDQEHMEVENNAHADDSKDDDDWRQIFSTQSEQFLYMYKNNIRTDCTFIVGPPGQQLTFCCHKIQLARCSSKFDAIFFEGESKVSELVITKVEANIFQLLINYVYTDQVEFSSVEEALSLYSAAKYYGMIHLCSACASYIGPKLTADNFWPVFKFAQELQNQEVFKQKCLKFLQTNTKSCLQSENIWKEMTQSTLLILLQQDILQIDSELELIKTAVKWAENKQKSKGIRTTLDFVFSLFRFLTLTPNEFADNFSQSDLLTTEEKFAIHVKISHPTNPIKVPGTICTNLKQRNDPRQNLLRQEIPAYVVSYTHHTCYRQKVSENSKMKAGRSSYALFRVDRDIKVYGVIISPAVQPKDKKLYDESISVKLLKYNYENDDNLDIEFEKTVPYNRQINIMFKQPFKVKKGTLYEIDVSDGPTNSSMYRVSERQNVVVDNGCTFEFLNKPSDYNGLIEGLYFL